MPNAVFLDDDALELAGGGRVIGSTLWSHVPDEEIGRYNEMLAADGLQGVDNIRFDERFLTLRDTNELHSHARSFIEDQLRSLSEAERDQTIVCTHFWPTLRPWTGPDGDHGEPWYYMTGSDLDSLIAECGPRRWLCGHAHTTHHVTIGTTGCSMKLVVESSTPGMITFPSGSLTSSNTVHSCSCRGAHPHPAIACRSAVWCRVTAVRAGGQVQPSYRYPRDRHAVTMVAIGGFGPRV